MWLNLVTDGISTGTGATAMFLPAGAYGYATPGNLTTVMPSETYQQALQQQVFRCYDVRFE